MKAVIGLCFVTVFAIALARPDDEKDSHKYDHLQLDIIVSNKFLFEVYYNCFLDKTDCTPGGKVLKSLVIDALKTECSTCNDNEKEDVKTVFRYLINGKPEIWEELTAKYDPTSIYAPKYEKELDVLLL